jgi:AraC family transcriptional regulator
MPPIFANETAWPEKFSGASVDDRTIGTEREPSVFDHGVTIALSGGGIPDVATVGRSPGQLGIDLLGCQFHGGIHAQGVSREHMIFLTLQCGDSIDCRIADIRLNHLAAPGNLTICPAGADVFAEGGGDYAGLVLFVPKDTLSFALAESGRAGATLIERCQGRDPGLMALARSLERQAAGRFADGPLAWEEATTAVVQRLIDAHLSDRPRPLRGRLDAHALLCVSEYVQDNLDRAFSVQDLADIAKRSRSHFPRLFRRTTGLSPYNYVLKARLHSARALLQDGRLPIAEVALRTGFADQSHLCNWIKRAYGGSPRELKPV